MNFFIKPFHVLMLLFAFNAFSSAEYLDPRAADRCAITRNLPIRKPLPGILMEKKTFLEKSD